MKIYVADTHTILWYLSGNKRLSAKAKKIFKQAQMGRSQVIIPSITLVETIFLVQREKVDRDILNLLLRLSENPRESIYIYSLHKAVVLTLGDFGPAAVPELADRIIAATARYLGAPLLTRDNVIQSSSLVETIW